MTLIHRMLDKLDLVNKLRARKFHQVKLKEKAWRRAEKWIISESLLGFFPFTFWVWKSGWHSQRARLIDKRLRRLTH